ncbi:hypothetical protein GLYMA_01G185851v4 [Glycine max]|nr:hypothetical protein GLYMA_01G185851v4 [Glycine max]KAH1163787.1 hypothetical protein GYH30_002017 [Glycine max]
MPVRELLFLITQLCVKLCTYLPSFPFPSSLPHIFWADTPNASSPFFLHQPHPLGFYVFAFVSRFPILVSSFNLLYPIKL